MTVETEPMNLPAGSPDIDLEGYKIPEQEVPPKESFATRARSRRNAPKATKPKERVPASKPGEFVDDLERLYKMAAMGVDFMDGMRGNLDHNCGDTIKDNAHDIAVKWDELAQKDDSVRKMLRMLTQGSSWGGLMMAHAPIALALLSNHAPGSLPTPKINNDQQPEQDQPLTPVRTLPRKPQYKRPPVNGATHGA